MSNDTKIFGGMILGTIILIVGAVLLMGRGSSETPSNGKEAKPVIIAKKDLIEEGTWTVGSDSAKVTIVEFGDYQCPTCKVYAPIVDQVKDKYGDKIIFAYRHFPIVQAHPYAISAASAAEAAGNQGKFWEYHNELYKISPDLTKENLVKIAEKIELDMTKFNSEMDSDATRQKVLDDLAKGNSFGVKGTPTFYINGEQITLAELQNLKGFEEQIDPLLK